MGKVTGFKEYPRASLKADPVSERIRHYREFEHDFDEKTAVTQAARCMDCGVPFCHGGAAGDPKIEVGCPVDNLIPEFNDLVYRGKWREALENLHSTNNFPEFTGRLCPAPCESACVLGITDPAVSIKSIERTLIDRGFAEGWIKPHPAARLTGKKIAVVGSGPAGLACAQQLARAGHSVTVFEKTDRVGGLLRYGIPDFKMEKSHIDRRIEQMQAEGVEFRTGICVGKDISAAKLRDEFPTIVLATGSEVPRDLSVPGRQLGGVHFAMDFLTRQNRIVAGDAVQDLISAQGKNVIVIGGGDTGSDCVGTSHRQGAKTVTQIEILGKPPETRDASTPWPLYPKMLFNSSSQQEGGTRSWSITTLGFQGDAQGRVRAIQVKDGARGNNSGNESEWPTELVLLAMGFTNPVKDGLLAELSSEGLQFDARGNVQARFGTGTKIGDFTTSIPGVYACGDARRGQSLIVWAISEGRKCAERIHHDLETQ